MAVQKVITGNVYHHNGGVILQAGNSDGVNVTDSLTLAENAYREGASKNNGPTKAVSPGSSGNLGNLAVFSSRPFAQMEAGEYVAKVIGDRIAQSDDTTLRSGAADWGTRVPYNVARGYERYDNTSWDYVTGALTKGGSAGSQINYIDPIGGGAVSYEPYPTFAVPGELVFMDGDVVPTQADYAAKTSV